MVWALERKTAEEGQAWLERLSAPLPGYSAIDPDFDDSYNQIHQ